jgi:hypothetical protein
MSCLFNSLSYFLHDSSYDIRQKVCDYLEKNGNIVDGMDTKVILQMESSNYIDDMRNTSVWGGAIEIQCTCNIYNMRVIVHNHRNRGHKDIEFLPIHGNYDKTINIWWNGSHYKPIR